MVPKFCLLTDHTPSFQGLSASRELLLNLNGQGWTVVELAEAARKAGILSIIEILSTYCAEEGAYIYILSLL